MTPIFRWTSIFLYVALGVTLFSAKEYGWCLFAVVGIIATCCID